MRWKERRRDDRTERKKMVLRYSYGGDAGDGYGNGVFDGDGALS